MSISQVQIVEIYFLRSKAISSYNHNEKEGELGYDDGKDESKPVLFLPFLRWEKPVKKRKKERMRIRRIKYIENEGEIGQETREEFMKTLWH